MYIYIYIYIYNTTAVLNEADLGVDITPLRSALRKSESHHLPNYFVILFVCLLHQSAASHHLHVFGASVKGTVNATVANRPYLPEPKSKEMLMAAAFQGGGTQFSRGSRVSLSRLSGFIVEFFKARAARPLHGARIWPSGGLGPSRLLFPRGEILPDKGRPSSVLTLGFLLRGSLLQLVFTMRIPTP